MFQKTAKLEKLNPISVSFLPKTKLLTFKFIAQFMSKRTLQLLSVHILPTKIKVSLGGNVCAVSIILGLKSSP